MHNWAPARCARSISVGVCVPGMLAIEAIQRAESHPNTLYAAGSTQEEVGLRGATATANLIEPDVAIVLEGPPHRSPEPCSPRP